MASSQKFSVNLGLDQLPATQDRELFNELTRVYNALKNIAQALDTYTGFFQYDPAVWSQLGPSQTLWTAGANRLYLPFTDAAVAGSMMTVYDNAGVMSARLAGGAGLVQGKVRGYSTGVNAGGGAMGEIILLGLCSVVSGLTPGVEYYASNATPGAFTSTLPNTVGNRLQAIGYALTATTLFFNPDTHAPLVAAGPTLTP